jgi:hypothetical protein
MPEKLTIQELQDEYLICRALGHSWDDNPTGQLNGSLWRSSVGGLALRCTRCTTERFDYIGADMRVFQRYYRYPAHYTTVPGSGSRPNLRGEMLRRSLLMRRRRGGKANG